MINLIYNNINKPFTLAILDFYFVFLCNIIMKHYLIILIFLFTLSCRQLYSDPFNFNFSIEPQTGILYGQAQELVYQDESTDELLSELQWDIKPLFYYGSNFELLWGGKYFIALDLKFALPMESGIMEDRDWTGHTAELTHYSNHDVTANNATMFDLSLGFDVSTFLDYFFSIRFSLGLSYMNFSWTAHDGYLNYGKREGFVYLPLTDFDNKIPVNGSIITYSQSWIFMPLDLTISFFPDYFISFSIYFHSGPIIKFVGQDEHHLKKNSGSYGKYYDKSAGGHFFQPGAELKCTFLSKYSFIFFFSWTKLSPGDHGDSMATMTGTPGVDAWQSLGRVSGSGIHYIDTGLRLSFSF
jgi:outer membrane protease